MAPFLSNSEFTQLASEKQIEKTVQALQAHGIRVVVFDTGEEARKYVLDLIPSGAEVYNSPSRTLELLGLTKDIEHPTRFQSVRARLNTLDRVKQRNEMRKLGVSPDVLVGVLQLDMVDNSTSPGERLSGSFLSHPTEQVGCFILWAFALLLGFHLHQAAHYHYARLLQVSFTLKG